MMRDKYPNETHYSQHYTRKELNCKCGCKPRPWVRRNLRRLAVSLEQLRKYTGPIKLTSGHRCKAYNKKVGGARFSQHIRGKAADLYIPKERQKYILGRANKIKAFRRGGIGVYPNGGIHLDIRPTMARWNSFKGQ